MAVIDSRYSGCLSTLATQNNGSIMNDLREFIASCTGLNIQYIRSRAIARPAKRPPISASWCAVGMTNWLESGLPEVNGVRGEDKNIDSQYSFLVKHQTFECIASFYGSNAFELVDTLRDSLRLPQNLDLLSRKGLTIRSVGDVVRSPDFYDESWVDRYDVTFVVARKSIKKFGIRNIASADVELITEKGKINAS